MVTCLSTFAYEVIFGVPARELFPGVYEKVERQVTSRARLMEEDLSKADETPAVKLKKQLVHRILAPFRGEYANIV